MYTSLVFKCLALISDSEEEKSIKTFRIHKIHKLLYTFLQEHWEQTQKRFV